MMIIEQPLSNDGSPKVVLGYWNLRGGPRANPARYMLHYAGVPFEEKTYIIGERDWLVDKREMFDFVNLPYLLYGDLKISQAYAVQQFIAEKFKPELLGATPQERGRVYQLQGIAIENFLTFMKEGYRKVEKTHTAHYCLKYMDKFVKYLGDKKFLTGD